MSGCWVKIERTIAMMIKTKLAALSLGLIWASTAAFAQTPQQAVAAFLNPQGQEMGKAIPTQTSGLLIDIDVSNVPKGKHGFHIHETGTCNAADGFKSAGGHFEPAQHQ